MVEATGVVQKINSDFFDAISTEDMQQLFDVLDKDNNGFIHRHEFEFFLREVLDPPFSQIEVEAIFKFTDGRPDGLVTPEEVTRAFRNPVIKLQVAQLHRNYRVKKEFVVSQGVGAEVNRELLVERLGWRVRRDDAFASLPFSSLFTVLFLSLVVSHLQIWNRQQVERGLESWVRGSGRDLPGPYLQQAVADASSAWSWLASSGLSSVFGECGGGPGGAPRCLLSTRNALLGDAQLRQARGGGPERAAWLLHSEDARRHLASRPGDYLGAAEQALRSLRESGWIDEDTDSLQLVLSTYSEHSRIFATTRVTVGLDPFGYVEPVVVTSAVIADPYPTWAILVLDALYACCVLYSLCMELRDMASWCRTVGFLSGVRGYCGFWNGVDWINIIMGVVQACQWIHCCFAIQAGPIQELLEGGGHRKLVSDVMQLDTDALERVRDELAHVIGAFFWLHVIMAANVFTVLLKFFKAFGANPKLQLVTDTLANAANDIFHFCIVSCAVFVGYAVIGHILFGRDIVSFNTLTRSMNTAFTALMGDFGWYVEESGSDVHLGSGVPWFLVVAWFWSFMVFSYLILMNMLMAIILEHYADCFAKVKSNPDACALWVQAWQYVRRAWRAQGSVPFSQILLQLVDDKHHAHPEELVTAASLQQAFHLAPDQAALLMRWLGKEAKKRMKENEGGQDKQLARLVEVEGFLEGMAEILRIVLLNVSQCDKSLQEMQASRLAAPEDHQDKGDIRGDLGDAGAEFAQQLQTQSATVKDLGQAASVLRDVVAHLGARRLELPTSVDSPSPPKPQDGQERSLPTTGCCSVRMATREPCS